MRKRAEASPSPESQPARLPSVDLPTPKSDAIPARGNPLDNAILTASYLKSSLCVIAVIGLLELGLHCQVTAEKPLQVHYYHIRIIDRAHR